MSERLAPYKRLTAAAMVTLGALSLAGCSTEYNYEGAGNHYRVHGTITDVEDDGTIHINEKVLVVDEAEGRAASWFENNDGHNAFSEDFNFESFYRQHEEGWFGECDAEVEVGKIYDWNGQEIKVTQLKPGEEVSIDGSIRDSRKWRSAGKTMYCGSEEYSVYDNVQVIG